MKRLVVALGFIACTCGPSSEPQGPVVSKEPISVRGWIVDVDHPTSDGSFKTVETEAARKAALFAATYVAVENAPYVSGGVDENGAFVLLDVPPGRSEIIFTAPGAPAAKLVLEKIAGNADVFIPGLLLKKDGVQLTQPATIRMAARVDKPRVTALQGIVAGQPVKVVETPIAQMGDRRDFPTPPTISVRLPTLK